MRKGDTWFNTAAFAPPGDYLFGNAERTSDDLRRDSYRNVNLSLLKNFRWKGNHVQLRAELPATFGTAP